MKAKEYAWAYLIEHGGVVADERKAWSYYGGHYECSKSLTSECLTHLLDPEVSINWELTKDPADCNNGRFDGTFVDAGMVKALEGTLHLSNGKSYFWGSEFEEEPVSVFQMLERMSEHPSILEIAKKKLEAGFPSWYWKP